VIYLYSKRSPWTPIIRIHTYTTVSGASSPVSVVLWCYRGGVWGEGCRSLHALHFDSATRV